MKRGGQIIYYGELGQNSSKLIEYFEVSYLITLNTLFLYFHNLVPQVNSVNSAF